MPLGTGHHFEFGAHWAVQSTAQTCVSPHKGMKL